MPTAACGSGCSHPNEVWRVTAGTAELVYRDDTAHVLAHPTNLAFRGDQLLTAKPSPMAVEHLGCRYARRSNTADALTWPVC